MIGALAKNRAWSESLTEEKRIEIADKLIASLADCDSPRDVASVVRTIAALELNDIARARLLLDADNDGEQAEGATALRSALDEIDRMEGGKPC